MDDDELGDTVIIPRRPPSAPSVDPTDAAESDTLLRPKAPVEPALVEPALVEPALVEPAPVEPAPVEPALVEPALVPPALVQPSLVEPAPDDRGARAGHLATAPVSVHRLRAGRYRYSLNDAAPVVLSGTLVIGRNPKPPRVADTPDLELVVVPSAGREVSATHLRVSQDGASIVVTDLKSTNGTIVTMPGSESFSLRSGESIVAVPGTVIDIGDGNHLEILPVERMPLAARWHEEDA